VFLVVAALFVQAYSSVATTELGFERDRVVVAELEPALHGYSADATERYIETLMSRLRTLPGVVDVAVADRVPFSIGFQRLTTVWPQSGACAGDTCPKVATYAVGARYFRTMGIVVREGREFDGRTAAAEVMVNEALARQQWPVSAESVADFGARRPAVKARRPRIPGVFEGGATPPGGMPRPEGAIDSADTGH
jgi:hypothetical protein